MKKRRILVPVLISLMMLANVGFASAGSDPNPEDMAVYLSGKFYGNSAYVDGSIYSANGDVEFTNSGANFVSGNIYHSVDRDFIIPNWYYPDFENRVYALNETQFDGNYPNLIDFPDTTSYEYIADHAPQHNTAVLTVHENTHFGNLIIDSTGSASPVVVDTSQGNVYIVADNISWGWNKSIKVVGGNKLLLFIKNCSSPAPVQIDNGNDPDSTYIFSNVNLFNGSLELYAHLYHAGISDLTILGKITGSVVTDADTITIQYGGNVVNGLVFAPNAAATILSPGSESGNVIPNIKGRLVAKSLNLTGSGRIKYDPTYASFEDNIIPEVQKHQVSVTANNTAWGTVTPSSPVIKDFGEVVNVTATPNAGYKFVSFTSTDGSPLPDANGNVTVNRPINIVANFAPDPPDVGYKNGILGEYYDAFSLNDAALRMKRIDSHIAMNLEYDKYPDTGNTSKSRIDREDFSIRWTGFIKPTVTGDYTFKAYSDDGVKFYIGGEKILDSWGLFSLDFQMADRTIHLNADQYYPITFEYQQGPLYAAAFLFWEAPGVPMGLVPESAFYVSESTYDGYSTPVYVNELDKEGEGFTNKFYSTLSKFNSDNHEFMEISNVDYSWGLGAPEGIATDEFYGRMEGWLEAKFTEDLTLVFTVDDALKVWLDGNLVINEWDWNNRVDFTHTFGAVAGQKYKIEIEYADKGLGATLIMGWRSGLIKAEIVPTEYMYTGL